MTHEEFMSMAKEYAEKYIPRFKKVAENAYIDGMMDAMKLMRDKLTEHALEGYCQAMDDYCDECKERRAGL